MILPKVVLLLPVLVVAAIIYSSCFCLLLILTLCYVQTQELAEDVHAKQAPINEAISKAEHFQREYRERLHPEQKEVLQENVDKLKADYDQLQSQCDSTLKADQAKLDRLRREEEERVSDDERNKLQVTKHYMNCNFGIYSVVRIVIGWSNHDIGEFVYLWVLFNAKKIIYIS